MSKLWKLLVPLGLVTNTIKFIVLCMYATIIVYVLPTFSVRLSRSSAFHYR